MPPDPVRVTFEDILAFVSEPAVARPFQGHRNETVVEPDTRTGLSCADQVPLHPVVSRPDEVIQQWTIKRGDPAMDDKKMSDETQQSVSRRGFIKGVIAAGAVASSSAYLFR